MSSISSTTPSTTHRRHHHQRLGNAPDVSCWKGVEGTRVTIESPSLKQAKIDQHVSSPSSVKVNKTAKATLSPKEFEEKGQKLIELAKSDKNLEEFIKLYDEDPLLIHHYDAKGHNTIYHALHSASFQITEFILNKHPEYKERIHELLINPILWTPTQIDLRCFIFMLIAKGYCNVNELLARALVRFQSSSTSYAVKGSIRFGLAVALYDTGEVNESKVHEILKRMFEKHGYNYETFFNPIKNKVTELLKLCEANTCKLSLSHLNKAQKIEYVIAYYIKGMELLAETDFDKAKALLDATPELLRFKDWAGRSILYDALATNKLHLVRYLVTQFYNFQRLLPHDVSQFLSVAGNKDVKRVLTLLDMNLTTADEILPHILTCQIHSSSFCDKYEPHIAALVQQIIGAYPWNYAVVRQGIKRITIKYNVYTSYVETKKDQIKWLLNIR